MLFKREPKPDIIIGPCPNCAALRAENAALRKVARLLVTELGDGILEEMRGVWGNTQVACIRLRRDNLRALLSPQEPVESEAANG